MCWTELYSDSRAATPVFWWTSFVFLRQTADQSYDTEQPYRTTTTMPTPGKTVTEKSPSCGFPSLSTPPPLAFVCEGDLKYNLTICFPLMSLWLPWRWASLRGYAVYSYLSLPSLTTSLLSGILLQFSEELQQFGLKYDIVLICLRGWELCWDISGLVDCGKMVR